jgi:hypothetical protein
VTSLIGPPHRSRIDLTSPTGALYRSLTETL